MKLRALSPNHCQHLRNIVFLNNIFHLPVSSYSLMQNLLLAFKFFFVCSTVDLEMPEWPAWEEFVS